jgi:hypothetical protein
MFGQTAIDITGLTVQYGGLGIIVALVVVAIRAVWGKLWPHFDEMLKARLKRYEATTELTAGLQATLAELVIQQQQIVQLLDTVGRDSRLHRKAMQTLAKLMHDHRCLAGVDVRRELLDSDDYSTSEEETG